MKVKECQDMVTTFKCDGCGAILTSGMDEGLTLKTARELAKVNEWEWTHPHWQLHCNECKEQK